LSHHYDPEHPSLWDSVGSGQHELGIAEGRRRRDEGQRHLRMADPLEPWYDNAWRAVKALADWPGTFTSDAIRSAAGDPPKPNAMGALLNQAARAGLIEWRGELEQSERPTRHAAWLKVWHGVKGPA